MAERKLSKYNQKRDFKKTAEPSGKVSRTESGNSYLIQKHAASRLHYDFRLELNGVLKSWAVTRGPSLDPHDKRLAVEVEDHPVAYGTFEGIIPEGEYGGGTVMLWDEGTWEPTEDPHKGLKNGSLKFRLYGKRLKGDWALVRMKDREKDRGRHNWLLIKHTDQYAKEGAGEAYLAKHATSVKSKRSMEKIAKDADKVWGSKAATKSSRTPKEKAARGKASKAVKGKLKSLPAFIPPQLATLVNSMPKGKEWLHEVKFDGYRVLTYLENGKARMMTRSGLDWTDKFGDISEIIARLKVDHAILDGELVSLNAQKVSSFSSLKNALSEGGNDLSYYVFDLLYLDGQDIRKEPLLTRKKQLEALLKKQKLPRVFYSDHFAHEGTFYDKACKLGLEGVISKRSDAPYTSQRSKTWLKTKCHKRQEFVIGGYTDSSTGAATIGSLLLGYYEGDDFVYAGRVGTGFDQKTARNLYKALKALNRKTMAYTKYSDKGRRGAGWKRDVHWVDPELVCEVEFTEWTEEGALRHPSFQGLREDKPAKKITRDIPIAVTRAAKQAKAEVTDEKPKERAATASDVTLSHPDKILWRDKGYTKQDLANYYRAVAKWMLPHLAERPVSLVRCPAGSDKHCFFQRHSGEGLSEHIETLRLKRKDEPYLYIRDAEGLMAMVQMGVLEIHQWGSHVKTWDKPDMIVFDFDPAPDVPFGRVKEAALEMRARLKKLKLESFLKTTGGKGLHVVVPITPEHDWDTIKQWARAMAELMAQDAPKRYTTNIRKAQRTGRIFIDYLRNGETATAIAPFSTRAREGAPVSVPLDWKELAGLKTGSHFTIATVPARLKKQKTDPWKKFFVLKQKLPV